MIKYALSNNENVARKCIYSFFMHKYVKTTKPLAVKGDCPPRQAASGLHFDTLAKASDRSTALLAQSVAS